MPVRLIAALRFLTIPEPFICGSACAVSVIVTGLPASSTTSGGISEKKPLASRSMAPTVRVTPARVYVVLSATRLLLMVCPACGPVLLPFTPMRVMFSPARVLSSLLWLMPSWFRSRQT